MHRRGIRLSIAAIGIVALSPALALAAAIPITGTLAIQLVNLAPITISGSGTAVVNGSGGGAHLNTLALPAGIFATAGLVLPVTDPAVYPIEGVQLTVGNSAGTIAGGSGVIPLNGVAKVCLFGSCPAAVANLDIPLSVIGNGGASFSTAAVNLTVIGAPWTTGTAAIGTITRMGFAHGPASGASSTALPSGELQLVTPIFTQTNIGSSPVIPGFAILTLHFVPEPATLALVGGGLALLAAAGRRRLHAASTARETQ